MRRADTETIVSHVMSLICSSYLKKFLENEFKFVELLKHNIFKYDFDTISDCRIKISIYILAIN